MDIYADEGISGTSLQHRDNFVRMINDCGEGKIDLIVTKSVSRFARNIIDCIGYIRQLKAATPPIGIYFETENIFTLDENSEMALSFIATLAQEESHTKSEIMNASIEMRFKRGIFLTPVLLGYDHDADGNLIINEDEAKTVRLIFFSYLYGYSTQQIADALTELERLTKKGNRYWSSKSILSVLSNERYCGDVLARKTYTPNYLDHKSKKNNKNRNQYRHKEHHEAIISREDFFAVQKMIRNAKYGNKGYFPEMHVINSGILRGYVSVHPKWAGFSEDDYYMASDSINEGLSCIASKPIEITVSKGDFDLSGYELVRSEFMSSYGQLFVTATCSTMSFNKASILKMSSVTSSSATPVYKVELWVYPNKHLMAVKRAPEDSHYAVEWCKNSSGKLEPKSVSGSAFLPTLYKMFGWRKDRSYRIKGTAYNTRDGTVIIYDAHNAIMFVDEDPDKLKSKKIMAYPVKWADNFGESYYKSQAITIDGEDRLKKHSNTPDSVYKIDNEEGVTTKEEAAKQITNIIKQIGGPKDG